MKLILLLLSLPYGLVVDIRNFLFNTSILKSKAYHAPIISMGNITVGGTGKTPHTELLIKELKGKYNIAVLSRGYKRKSRGFHEVMIDSTASEHGDEPVQMKSKFPEITVVVDKNRRNGIDKLLSRRENRPDVILLDDAYQHRYVNPGINILLVDSHRPINRDKMLPLGRLRERFSEKSRANMVIVTKCSEDLKPIDYRIIRGDLDLMPYQRLFFTSFDYLDYLPAFPGQMSGFETRVPTKNSSVLLVTGIASPKPLIDTIKGEVKEVDSLVFPDHHNFTAKDLAKIDKRFNDIESDDKVIITTEKDVCRLRDNKSITATIKANTIYRPIEVKFLDQKRSSFLNHIIRYIDENRANSSLGGLKDYKDKV